MPLFSILIPTRNRAELVVLAIRSAQAQTCADWEVVVCDNQSADQTAEVVKKMAAADARVRYVQPPKFLALADNWDYCRRQAMGEYVLLIGDDDYLVPDALESIRQATMQDGQPEMVEYKASWFDYTKKSWLADAHGGKTTVEPVDTSRAFSEWFGKFTHYYFELPLLVCYKRQTAEAACADGGALYVGLYPDLYAVGALLLQAGHLARIDRALVVLGITPKSLGPQQEKLNNLKALQENAGNAPNPTKPTTQYTQVSPPLPGQTPANFHYEALMLLKARYPKQLEAFTPSMHAYGLRHASKLLDLQFQSHDAPADVQADIAGQLRRFWGWAPLPTKLAWLLYVQPRGWLFHSSPDAQESLRNAYRQTRGLASRTSRPLDAADIEQAAKQAKQNGWLD